MLFLLFAVFGAERWHGDIRRGCSCTRSHLCTQGFWRILFTWELLHEFRNIYVQNIVQLINLLRGQRGELRELNFLQLFRELVNIREVTSRQIVFLQDCPKDIGQIIDQLLLLFLFSH
eukprot:Lithocolla_globosa_v1_NODE_2597_length_1939_cov_9.176752.p2 type:complete len:118 gc:universal NODE_2597_length_1939_cov_9.176752:428-781(+)